MKLLITGGAGFIGSAVVRHFVERNVQVINIDALTYAGNLESLKRVAHAPNYVFIKADITNQTAISDTFRKYRPDAVMHLAAESHVDRSIDGSAPFIRTNIQGTHTLLEAARAYWKDLPPAEKSRFRFHHVSTDEVYGELGPQGAFTENTSYAPNSPYAASKASADHLVRAWYRTYNLPVLISNCSNNYGPYQFPEKLIPLTIINAHEGKPLPVYGRGENVRDWLYVEDHVAALELILREGNPGETYNVGGGTQLRNIEVVEKICALMDELSPKSKSHTVLIRFVADRPGHDFRYAINAEKISAALGWHAQKTFEAGLRETVSWYLDNRDWWERIRSGVYRGDRLGASN